jgi:hypothetical protein
MLKKTVNHPQNFRSWKNLHVCFGIKENPIIEFLTLLGTWMPNLYLIPAGLVETLSILAISTAVFDLLY